MADMTLRDVLAEIARQAEEAGAMDLPAGWIDVTWPTDLESISVYVGGGDAGPTVYVDGL